jgi:DNA-directed RNA polymerase specialized sigma24 family protein
MAWQDGFPLSASRMDAEQERELRLVAQARAGAEWALAALIARYQPPVTRYLTRLTGDPERSRVLAEAIFVRMAHRLRGPQGGQHLRLWLLRACTEAGLDALREPRGRQTMPPRLEGAHGPAGLLTGRVSESTSQRLRKGLEALAEATGTTRRQFRKLIWSEDEAGPEVHPSAVAARADAHLHDMADADELHAGGRDALEALRYRMMRAVLAELPYGDAQCLALHLVAGLNQTEVAKALGLKNSATRSRIVHGLQLFAQRFEAAAASLGLPAAALAPRATQPPIAALGEPAAAFAPALAAEAVPEDAPPLPWREESPSDFVDAVTAPLWAGNDADEASLPPAAFAATPTEPLVVDAEPVVALVAPLDLPIVFERTALRGSMPPGTDATDLSLVLEPVPLAFEPEPAALEPDVVLPEPIEMHAAEDRVAYQEAEERPLALVAVPALAAPAAAAGGVAGEPVSAGVIAPKGEAEGASELVALAESPQPLPAVEQALRLEETAADLGGPIRVVPVLTPPWILVRREPAELARENDDEAAADPAPLVPVLTPVPAGRPSTRPGGGTDITLRAVSLLGNEPLETPPAARADDVTMGALEVPAAPADDAPLEP